MGDVKTVRAWMAEMNSGCAVQRGEVTQQQTDALARVLAVAEAVVAHHAAMATTDEKVERGGPEWHAAMEAEHSAHDALTTAVAALRGTTGEG
jgi:hypothetical protein